MQRTITLILEASESVAGTIDTFNGVTNFFLKTGFENGTYSKSKLQMLAYREARDRWPLLQSSLVQGARDCACDMLKRENLERLPVKRKGTAIRYNRRTFSAFLGSGFLSISTIDGRIKVPVRIPAYFNKYAGGRVAALRIRHTGGVLRADLVMDLPNTIHAGMPANPSVMGIDRGIVNIAVTSDNSFFNSRKLREVRGRYRYLRQRLQSAGTPSARRHLKRTAGRERRFQTDVNHRIAKDIAGRGFDVIASEELHICRNRRNGRRFNTKLGGWAYGQLDSFLRYKCEEKGLAVVHVAPEYTSRDCSVCHARGVRKGSVFNCNACGVELNADLNASRNIAYRGISALGRPRVNRPIVADLSGYKPPISIGGS